MDEVIKIIYKNYKIEYENNFVDKKRINFIEISELN